MNALLCIALILIMESLVDDLLLHFLIVYYIVGKYFEAVRGE
jgi:hypothetical protein